MVFVSNHSSTDIDVSISASTGGNANRNTLSSNGLEKYATNYWHRTGTETLKVQLDGKDYSFEVGENDHVTIYDDGYEVVQTTVRAF
jgi:hypothetical protein